MAAEPERAQHVEEELLVLESLLGDDVRVSRAPSTGVAARLTMQCKPALDARGVLVVVRANGGAGVSRSSSTGAVASSTYSSLSDSASAAAFASSPSERAAAAACGSSASAAACGSSAAAAACGSSASAAACGSSAAAAACGSSAAAAACGSSASAAACGSSTSAAACGSSTSAAACGSSASAAACDSNASAATLASAPGAGLAPSTSTSSSSSIASSGGDPSVKEVLLRHLEPMELVVTLDDAYPASQPLVELRCSWLEAGQVSCLVQALRELSLSSGAGGSLFAMFELVRYQGVALSCGSDDASGAPVVAVRSARALARLRAYAAAQFPSEVHCCGMCFEELPGARLKQLPCSHPYCVPCLERFAELHVREGSVGSLVCCAARCGCPLPPQLVGELLAKKDPRAAERYEEMLLRKGLEAMGDVAPCPRCQAVCVADADGIALCQCFFSFCTKCRGEYHPGTPCLTLAKKIADLEERLAREADREAAMQGLSLAERAALLHVSLQGKQGGAALSANAVAQDRSALQNELATLRAMLDMGARQCPRCRLYALKSEGCNKMVCSQCQCLWCYRCGADISNEGYQHFRVAEVGERGAAPCAGRLFEEEDVRRNNAQFNRELLRARQDGAHAPPVRCPGCQTWCVKFNNNNHLRCVNCPAAFCCLCRQIVTKPGLHFGPGRCKQHS